MILLSTIKQWVIGGKNINTDIIFWYKFDRCSIDFTFLKPQGIFVVSHRTIEPAQNKGEY
jgi:hypothetical protein